MTKSPGLTLIVLAAVVVAIAAAWRFMRAG